MHVVTEIVQEGPPVGQPPIAERGSFLRPLALPARESRIGPGPLQRGKASLPRQFSLLSKAMKGSKHN